VKKLILAVILIASSTVYAEQGQLNLLLSGYTDHFTGKTYQKNGKYYTSNDFNPGVGLTYEAIDNLTIAAGVINNSVDQTSVLGFVQYDFLKYSIFTLGVSEQASSGYQRTVWTSTGGKSYSVSQTNNMRYATNLALCIDTRLAENHSPQVCAKSPIAQSNGNAFNQVTFYLEIPLTNFLQD
jgi:hypothetical protein